MKLLTLKLHTLEPVIATAGSSEGMAHSCLDYLPGNMILGAFASAWIMANRDQIPDDSPAFQKLFLDGSVSWGNALPMCGDNPTIPAPLCLMREKSLAGLPVYGQEVPPVAAVFNPLGLKDEETLGALYYEKILGKPKEEVDKDESPPKFKRLSASFLDPVSWCQPDLPKVWNTRVALGKNRSAERGLLFGFSALAPGADFRAEIHCQEDAEKHLRALLENLNKIHLGHSRSSGHGLCELAATWSDLPEAGVARDEVFYLFLKSHYFPRLPWRHPLESFVAEIAALAGSTPEVDPDRLYVGWERLEGFNGHWRAWRDSRLGMAAGSVLKLHFGAPIALPTFFSLGAGLLEGYGHVQVNPAFLRESLHICGATAGQDQKKEERGHGERSGATNLAASPKLSEGVGKILRLRAKTRLAEDLAQRWLGHRYWSAFIADAERLSAPSANQRGNALFMDLKTFKSMGEKTPGKQWKTAIVSSPFRGGKSDHLFDVMLVLLDPEQFLAKWREVAGAEVFAIKMPMPGGEPDASELNALHLDAYGRFKRELIRSWHKRARISQKDGQGVDNADF